MTLQSKSPDNPNKDVITVVARLARMLVIQCLYNRGLLTEKTAREALSGPLTPGDETTIYDDANCLEVKQ